MRDYAGNPRVHVSYANHVQLSLICSVFGNFHNIISQAHKVFPDMQWFMTCVAFPEDSLLCLFVC